AIQPTESVPAHRASPTTLPYPKTPSSSAPPPLLAGQEGLINQWSDTGLERDRKSETQREHTSDVTSPIFKPEIGFPMGNSLQFLLYFTDNGLIVFPSAESEVYRYTNPFSGGFTASSTIPMIAAFWADADLSAGATVFYQEYHTYRSESPSLIQRVEGIIKKYFEIQYKAKWTLKITWDKIPAFPTNTFQAVLSTDGSQSFVLIFYKCDGMNWDVSTLVSTNVLIGFNSGDGYFENDKQTELTVTERYRPDKYIGTNTDLKGLWAYKLIEGSPQKNYRAECLNWFLSEPDPANWNQALFSCPCTFNQGQYIIHIIDYQSSWTEFDLDPYNWCCIKVDDPLFCSYYEMKRPKDMCQGYRAPTAVLALGDPHFTTIDGLNYTFNGLGDYVLVNVQDSSTKTIFKLHGRTGQTGSAKATNFMAFAAQHLSTKNTTSIYFVVLDTSKEIYEDGAFSLEKSASGSTITATFDGGISLTATAKFAMLTIAVFLPEDYLNKTEGLFGLWNRDPNDDLKMPNGTIIPINSTESAIFDYGRTCEFNANISEMGDQLYQEYSDPREDSIRFNINRVYLFKIPSISSNFVLNSTANGTLTWIPRSTDGFFLEIEATGSNNASSVVHPRLVLCNCNNNGECNFNETLRINGSSVYVRNGTTCAAILCDSSPCPASYCDNGVTCIPEPTNACSPSCECPPQYQGDRCSLPTSQFMAEPLSSKFPQLLISLKTGLANITNVLLCINRALSGRIATAVASSFNYNGNKTIIDFLNDELINEIIKAFNKQRSRRSLQDETVDFETVNRDDIQDVKKVLQYELLSHFSCNNTVFAGYVVQWDEQDGVVCRSPCDMDHCLNEAKCQHLPTGPQCICIPRTIYSTFGDRCEHLSMNLRAFFGILFGALAFLLLLLLAIFLIVWKCKTSKRQQLINDTSRYATSHTNAKNIQIIPNFIF
uniref:EGF-like domain-containing protein n=1 Tax=Callorhinchus milii TaxID=7868 RepID=A0A4W3HV44_CALMI